MSLFSFFHRPLRATSTSKALVSALCVGWFFCSTARAAQPAKTYTLFEGNNIAVGQSKDVYPVRDVNGGSWVVMVDGKEVLVSGKSGPINMKVTPLTKLSDVSVIFAHLTVERGYTFNNDPSVRLTRAMGQSAQLTAGSAAASNQAAAAQATGNLAPGVGGSPNVPSNSGTSTAAAAIAGQGPSLDSKAPGSDLIGLGGNDADGNFDALDVSFEISSATSLAAPYIVTTTRIHEVDSPEGSFRNVVFAKALKPVTSNPTKVTFQQANFPFGYQLDGYEIHIYDGGREVASNVAPKRQVFTLDQAFEYVRKKYVETHQAATAAAAPVMGDLPADFRTQLATGKYAVPVYVKVSADGLAQEAFSDQACTTKIEDPFVHTVLHGIRFQPALAAGKPVEGTVELNLSKMRI